MTRIIPGVQVEVVKEVVAPQLAPSGVLGLVGLTETGSEGIGRASSWSRYVETFGRASAFSIPAAGQALANGVFELVVAPVQSTTAVAASVDIPDASDEGKTALTIKARVPGPWANGIAVQIASRQTLGGDKVFDLTVLRGDNSEVLRKLAVDPETERPVAAMLQGSSVYCTCELAEGQQALWPKDGEYELDNGRDASSNEYIDALRTLANEADVDLVLVDVQSLSDAARVAKIYSEVVAHCEKMSSESKGRIGFGQLAPGAALNDYEEMVGNLVSDRFVLLAPHGVAGAVAGMIGKLRYFHSPTFKTVAGLGQLRRNFGVEDQRGLLKANVVPVVNQRGRGNIVLRGLTSDGDQISVRRVADRAVRGVQMLGELFIGRLNNETGRAALKQKLVEFLVQMEKDGALVPSTDGSDPAFKCDVYSSQADFQKGIVRVDLAVRPVRAIDYIYATILVQA
ncbi:MAG: phage tail sheath protein [Proteobacteria bacterium]|nr:phage tail sheath protein [Pseudomonadota bacterium]